MNEDTIRLVFRLDRRAPLPGDLSYHHISGKHLWIAIGRGSVVVLDDRQHEIFERLRRGDVPRDIVAGAADPEDCLRDVTAVVRKCGEAGFIDGFTGYRIPQSSNGATRFARLHITRRCQFKCIHCYMDAGLQHDECEELTGDEWKEIIGNLADGGCTSIIFTGGEPLIRRDCMELLKLAHDRGVENIGVMTNGLLVPRRIEELARYATAVQIGMDGADEETNDKIRGKGTFKKIIEALDALSRTDLDVKVSVALMEMNWQSLRDNLAELASRYDKSRIKFKIGKGLLDYGRATSLRDSLDTFPIQGFVAGFNASFYPPSKLRLHQELRICGIFSQILIGHDGQVYPCHLQHRSMGHIKDRPIREWQRLYEASWRQYTVDHISGCRDCDIRNLCGGSCRALDRKRTGSEFLTSCTPDVIDKTYQNLVRIYT